MSDHEEKGLKIKDIVKELGWSDNIISINNQYTLLKTEDGEYFITIKHKPKNITVKIDSDYIENGINLLVHAVDLKATFVLKSYQRKTTLSKRELDAISN